MERDLVAPSTLIDIRHNCFGTIIRRRIVSLVAFMSPKITNLVFLSPVVLVLWVIFSGHREESGLA